MSDALDFIKRISSMREELADIRNGVKGPIKELNDSIKLLEYEVDDLRNKRDEYTTSYNNLTNPNGDQNIQVAAMFGVEAAFYNMMFNNTNKTEISEEDKKRIDELNNLINEYSNKLVEKQEIINAKKKARDNIITDFDNYGKIFYYMHIFDVDIKNAGSIEKFGEILSKYDDSLEKLIDSKIHDKLNDVELKIDNLDDDVVEIRKDIESTNSNIASLKTDIDNLCEGEN